MRTAYGPLKARSLQLGLDLLMIHEVSIMALGCWLVQIFQTMPMRNSWQPKLRMTEACRIGNQQASLPIMEFLFSRSVVGKPWGCQAKTRSPAFGRRENDEDVGLLGCFGKTSPNGIPNSCRNSWNPREPSGTLWNS